VAHFLWIVACGINAISLSIILMRLVRLRRVKTAANASISIVLPVTGSAARLDELIEALNAQAVQPGRLFISVESESDPAFPRAVAAAGHARFPVELVVAGHALAQAQKCRNQQAALERIGPETDIIVLMDADIQPGPQWLGMLAAPVASGSFDIVSGHRWQRVARQRLGAHLVAAVDRSVSLLPRLRPGFARVAWGGSIAISAAAARRMDLHGLFQHALSDDLALARRAVEMELRLGTRASLLVPSPNEQRLGPAWSFVRRQYQMCRIYRPALWGLAFGIVSLRMAGWGAAVLLALADGMAVLAVCLLAGLGGLKQYWTGELARRLGLADPWSVRLVQMALGVCQPVPDLFHLSAIAAAGWARVVRWGHITYRVAGPARIQVHARRSYSD